MANKLAVLVPVFNGGDLLRETVESCENAELAPGSEVLIVDNCSADSTPDFLPVCLGNGLPVRVYRNERNIGRVANWNKALEIAGSGGFTHATFLFVGDRWTPGASVGALVEAMTAANSVLGMASMRIVDEAGKEIRAGARLSIEGLSSHVASQTLLNQSINTGRLPFAPIQANIYRLFGQSPLRFDTSEENSLNADIEGTILYLQQHPGPVTVYSEPYLEWRERRGRFFTAQDPWFVFAETRRLLQRLSAAANIPVNWKSANAIAMLAALREAPAALPWYRRLAFQIKVLRYLLGDSAGLSAGTMCRFIAKKLISRQSYLVIDRAAAANQKPGLVEAVAE